jgi:hypothetical protein
MSVAGGEYLPPVVVAIVLDDTQAIAGLAGFKGAVSAATDSAGVSTGKMSSTIGAAERDLESKNTGFASRMGSTFTNLGSTMGRFGVPFSSGVTRMGSDMSAAEGKGKGFTTALAGIGRAAAGVGLALAVGIGVAAVKAADTFDVAQTRLKQAVENTGHSFASVEPIVKKTETQFTDLGFTTAETAGAFGTLITSSHNVALTQREMGIAADLSRYKHISLTQASETLAKVNAGSVRPLMQMGIQLDIGSTKLAAQAKATEALAKAKTALKGAEENMVVAAKKGAEEHAAALAKVEAAESSLKTAQDALKSDTVAITSAQESLKTAQQGVTEAAEKQKTAIKEASAALKQAKETERETAEAGAKSVGEAKKNLSSLEKERVKEGNEATIKTIENNEKSLEATKTSTSAAELITLKARRAALEAADKAMETGKKEEALQEAHLKITEAESTAHKNNKKAVDAVTLAHEKLVKAHKDALQSSKENVAATHAVTAAHNSLSSAEQKLGHDQEVAAKASQALAAAQTVAKNPPKAVEEAQKKLAAAHEKVSEAEKKLSRDMVAKDTILGALETKLHGMANTYTHTLAGSMDVVKAKMFEMEVEIGGKLIPVLLSILNTVKAIAGPIASIFRTFIVQPMQWIGRATANLVTAWENDFFHIRSITETVVKIVWTLLVGLPLKVLKMSIEGWGKIVHLFSSVMGNLGSVVAEGIGGVVHFFATLPAKLWNIMMQIVNDMVSIGAKIVHALVSGIESVGGAVGGAIKGLFHGIPVIGGALSAIGLATGGIVTKPTLAMVGEAGPEAVIPLTGKGVSPDGVKPLPGLAPGAGTPTAPGSAGGGAGLHVDQLIVNGTSMSPSQLVNELYLKLRPMLQGS